MFSPSNDGFGAVWDWSYNRPKKNPLPRTDGAKDYSEDQLAEWEKSYDYATEMAKRYQEGYAVGLVNGPEANPYEGEKEHNARYPWVWGWYEGRRKFLRQTLRPIIKAHKPWDYILYSVFYPQDDMTGQDGDYEGGERYKPLTRKDVLERAVECLMDRWCKQDPVPADMQGILQYAIREDMDDGYEQLMTKKEMRKQRAEQEYAEMEKVAQEFAASCGFQLGTTKFLAALEKAVHTVEDQRENWNNPEVRMEEWAACQYAGVGSATYFDDLNFENGRYSNRLASLGQVWDYLERKFPILMMRYKEWKARRRKEKRSGKEG